MIFSCRVICGSFFAKVIIMHAMCENGEGRKELLSERRFADDDCADFRFAVEEEEAYRIAFSANGKGGGCLNCPKTRYLFFAFRRSLSKVLTCSREKMSDVNVA